MVGCLSFHLLRISFGRVSTLGSLKRGRVVKSGGHTIENETAERVRQMLLLIRSIMVAAAGVDVVWTEDSIDDACSYNRYNIAWLNNAIIDYTSIDEL